MWPLWAIIAVAVGGAVSLTVTAVVTVVYFERKRHRKLMAQHGLNRNISQMHRHHLSITDVDVASLPRAAKSLRDSYQRPRSESLRFYATTPSRDEVKDGPEEVSTHSSRQWLSPTRSKRFARKKKIAKVSNNLAMTRSPMSAITEATEPSRNSTPEPVELPAHITPDMTPERAVIPLSVKVIRDSHVSIDGVISPTAIPQGTSHGTALKSRSISTGSIAPPPTIPLPPLPNTAPFDPSRRASLTRSKSDISLHKREVSAMSQQTTVRAVRGFSGFMFELTGEDISRKQISDRHNNHFSFQFPKPETVHEADESLKTIDASTWTLPNSLRSSRPVTPTPPIADTDSGSRSVSMIDYDAIFSAGSSLSNSPTKPPEDVSISRPVSAVSISSADMFRHSLMSNKLTGSPRTVGHKRQNCVRIKNLTPVDSKSRLSSQLGRLAEAEEDHDSILLPSPARINEAPNASVETISPPVSIEESLSPTNLQLSVPIIKQPQAQSLRVRRPGWTSIKDKNKPSRPLPIPGDPTKQSLSPTHSADVVNNTISAGRVGSEISPTILEAIKTSGKAEDSPVSSIRTYSPSSPQRQKTQVQGPRSAPAPSLRARKQKLATSPIRRKPSENDRSNRQHQPQRTSKVNDADLHRSIAMLKTMALADPNEGISSSVISPAIIPVARTPSSRYADSPVIRIPKIRNRANTIAGHSGEQKQSPSINRQSSLEQSISQTEQQQPRYGFLERPATPPNAARLTCSPSSISIWEDASIGGDSPEQISRQTTASDTQRETSTEQQPSMVREIKEAEEDQPSQRYSPVKSHREHFDQLSTYSRNMSSQQYQQLGSHSQLQRESLWRRQQNQSGILGGGGGDSKSGLRSPRSKMSFGLEGLKDVPLGGASGGSMVRRTTSAAADAKKPYAHARTGTGMGIDSNMGSEGVGLGLKFGEKSMAYTVNDVDRVGATRLR